MNSSKVPVAHFEEKYLVYTDGKVQSLQNLKFIKPSLNSNGYWKVSLGLNGKRLQFLLHRLVAKHFIPNPYDAEQVNHIDGDKANNTIDNLEWVTPSQNIQHSLERGLRKGFMPITLKESLLLRTLQGEKIRDLAREVGRREETLSKMLRTLAEKTGRGEDWTLAMQIRRKNVAIHNLKKINTKNS